MSLLDLLDIKDSFITIDAMGCQKSLPLKFVMKKSITLLLLKATKGICISQLSIFLFIRQKIQNVTHQYCEQVDGGYGSVEFFRYWITDVLTNINDLTSQWIGLVSIGMAKQNTI